MMMACQMPEQRDTFARSASLNYASQPDMSNSPELFQTPLNQQRQLSGSLSGNKLALLPIAFQRRLPKGEMWDATGFITPFKAVGSTAW